MLLATALRLPRPTAGTLGVATLLGISGLSCAPAAADPEPPVIAVEAGEGAGARLQALLDTLSGPATVRLEAGRYVLDPKPYTDPACGNCQDPTETVATSRGLRITGSGIEVEGDASRPGEVVLETRAGYGVLFDGCSDCALRGATVTGGARSGDGRATDAGVVVRGGPVTVEDCVVRDNLGDSAAVHAVVVGIAGVAVRENADLTLRRCRIVRNSWDGVALYRGAAARVVENVIDGVDAARGGQHGGGRGTGIGATWDARVEAVGNRVTRYWKGIGGFVDAQVVARANVVEHILTWGLAYWAAGEGAPVAVFESNAVSETGACGVIVDRGTPVPDGADPGRLVGNVFHRTGQNEAYDSGEPYCAQRPIARHAVPEGFRIEGNVVHDVRQPGDGPVEAEVEGWEAFRERAAPVLEELRRHPPTAESDFVARISGG
jgi:hypothetical protein